MAIPAAAAAVASKLAQYAPQIQAGASAALAKFTDNKVKSPADIATYVGKSPERLAVVASAAVRAGMNPNEVFTDNIVGSSAFLMKLRDRLGAAAASLSAAVDTRGFGPQVTVDDTVSDEVRARRVRAALRVFGSAENYALSQGLTSADFAWFNRMQAVMR